MRLLVAEDEKALRDVIVKRLSQEGYSIDSVPNGEEALLYIEMGTYDCIIMDILMPKMSGIEVLKKMRLKGLGYPVLLLTAKDTIDDRVTGLDAGADDYLVKPFAYNELSARVRALLRRNTSAKTTVLQFKDLSMDTVSRQVHRADKAINLSAKEFALLECLLRNPNRVLTRSQIIEHVWNFDFDNDSNIVDVYIRYVRSKVDDEHDEKLIHTVRGMGYVLKGANE